MYPVEPFTTQTKETLTVNAYWMNQKPTALLTFVKNIYCYMVQEKYQDTLTTMIKFRLWWVSV